MSINAAADSADVVAAVSLSPRCFVIYNRCRRVQQKSVSFSIQFNPQKNDGQQAQFLFFLFFYLSESGKKRIGKLRTVNKQIKIWLCVSQSDRDEGVWCVTSTTNNKQYAKRKRSIKSD